MMPIGGFFELEIPAGGRAWHDGALALVSGRACLGVALDAIRPRRAVVPFYACEALLAPIAARGIAVERYPLTGNLEPDLASGPGDGDVLVYVNYFGLKTPAARRLAAAFGRRVVIDDTQGFFETGYPGAWSFNSARKFFGVPDGGYLYAPEPIARSFEPHAAVRYDHLLMRILGDQPRAFAAYQASEAAVPSAPLAMSRLSARLLAGVDYPAVAAARRANARALHERLAGTNRLATYAEASSDAVPFCYPLLPEPAVPREPLWQQGIYVPTLWPEVLEAGDGERFGRERTLAATLLPLPVDHRYGAADMARVAAAVAGVRA